MNSVKILKISSFPPLIFIPKKKQFSASKNIFVSKVLTYFDTFLFCVDYFLNRYGNNFRVII